MTIETVVSEVQAYADQKVIDATTPLLGKIAALRAQLAPPLPAGWSTTVLLDEFDSLSNWRVRNGTTQLNTLCNNWASNVSLRDGKVVITGKRGTTTVNTASGPRTCVYTSGYLNSLFTIKKGTRVELWALLPLVPGISAGLWPAPLWFRDLYTKFEFDLVEGWGEPTSGIAATKSPPDVYRSGSFSSSCYADTDDQSKGKRSNWATPAGSPPVGDGKFHLFAFEWDDKGMRASYDGHAPHLDVTYSATPWLAGVTELELRMNLQIGNKYWGNPNAQTVFPAEMIIERLRVLRP